MSVTEPGSPIPRTWRQKFRDAFRGIGSGMRGQASFRVHMLVAVAVLVAAAILRCDLLEWCVLLLCIAGVLTAEMFNSALEHMAKAISKDHDPQIGEALDTGSAAVLLASIGAAIVGAIVFICRLWMLLH
jgi:diacylglycerol kinase